MNDVFTITPDELIERIKVKLASTPRQPSYSHFSVAPAPTPPAAFVLILGAGFSCGVVPLVDELMQQTIGDYYPDQDQCGERPTRVLRKDSMRFWAEFNAAAAKERLQIVELDSNGLPKNPGAAYQCLFTGEGAKVLFAQQEPKNPSRNERIKWERVEHQAKEEEKEKQNTGRRFVNGFLQYVLNPGAEHGWGATGRSKLNSAHIYLATLLEAQQLGKGWTTGAFCRTIFTTNFDTLLQNAFQMVNLLYRLTDRPEKGFEHSDFAVAEGPIHLVYTHGSILRHNPANTADEVDGLVSKNIDVLRGYLESRDVIIIGYSGWNDGLMAALRRCHARHHRVYWCDIQPEPASHVIDFLRKGANSATYVRLGEGGAGDFMRGLYEALTPAEFRRDPIRRYQEWSDWIWNRKAEVN